MIPTSIPDPAVSDSSVENSIVSLRHTQNDWQSCPERSIYKDTHRLIPSAIRRQSTRDLILVSNPIQRFLPPLLNARLQQPRHSFSVGPEGCRRCFGGLAQNLLMMKLLFDAKCNLDPALQASMSELLTR